MNCFEIDLNGQPYCVAGLEEGAMSAFVTYAFFPSAAEEEGLPVPPGTTLLAVSGFTADHTAVHWGDNIRALAVGDEVTVRLVERPDPDPWTATPTLPDPPPGVSDADPGDSG